MSSLLVLVVSISVLLFETFCYLSPSNPDQWTFMKGMKFPPVFPGDVSRTSIVEREFHEDNLPQERAYFASIKWNNSNNVVINGGKDATSQPTLFNEIWDYSVTLNQWRRLKNDTITEYNQYRPIDIVEVFGNYSEGNNIASRSFLRMWWLDNEETEFMVFGGEYRFPYYSTDPPPWHNIQVDATSERWIFSMERYQWKKIDNITVNEDYEYFETDNQIGGRSGFGAEKIGDEFVVVISGSGFWYEGHPDCGEGDPYLIDDVWTMSLSDLSWNRTRGEGHCAETPEYGDTGIYESSNTPAGRQGFSTTLDPTTNVVYMIGGETAAFSYSNHLFALNTSSWEWAFISGRRGLSCSSENIHYGEMNYYDIETTVTPREYTGIVFFQDSLIVVGGSGCSKSGGVGLLSDIVIFDLNSKLWKFSSRSVARYSNQYAEFGDDGIWDDANLLGGIKAFELFIGNNETDLFLLMGFGRYESGNGYLGNVWKLELVPRCFGISRGEESACNSLGTCSDHHYNPSHQCICLEGYSTDDCSVCNTTLFCNSRAISCSVVSGKKFCDCLEGYSGDTCELWKCNGKYMTESDVCNGATRGICVGPDNCQCTNEMAFRGTNCDLAVCDNSTGTTGCNDRGTCIETDVCSCDDWNPNDFCTTPLCYGKESLDESVCNGHDCLSPDECSCNRTKLDSNNVFVFGRECESKVGKWVVRSLVHYLTLYYSIKVSDLRSLYNVTIDEEFDCAKIIQHVDGIESCHFTSRIEMEYSVDSTHLLMIRIDPATFLSPVIVFLGLENEEIADGEEFEVYPSVYEKKSYTFRSYLKSEDSNVLSSTKSSLCKADLSGDENCRETYSCYKEVIGGEVFHTKVGFGVNELSERFFAKYYFVERERCENETRIAESYNFVPLICSGSSKGDVFIAYPFCESDMFNIETVGSTTFIALVSFLPFVIMLFVFLLISLCFLCISCSKIRNKGSKDSTKEAGTLIMKLKRNIIPEAKPKWYIAAKGLLVSVLKTMIVVVSILLKDIIYLYFATSEFSSTDDLDSSNENYILLKYSILYSSYMTWISIIVYVVVGIFFIIVFTGRFLIDPFLFCVAYEALKEWIAFRLSKGIIMSFIICANLFFYIIRFLYSDTVSQGELAGDFFWWLGIILPEILLLYELKELLNYNGVSSHTCVFLLKQLTIKELFYFPKVNFEFSRTLSSTEKNMDEFLQILTVKELNTIALDEKVTKSSEYGHLAWEFVEKMEQSAIMKYRSIFYPEVLHVESSHEVFEHTRILSKKWMKNSCSFIFFCRKKKSIVSPVTAVSPMKIKKRNEQETVQE